MSQPSTPFDNDSQNSFLLLRQYDAQPQSQDCVSYKHGSDSLCTTPMGDSTVHDTASTFYDDCISTVSTPAALMQETLGHKLIEETPSYPLPDGEWDQSCSPRGQQNHRNRNAPIRFQRPQPVHTHSSPTLFLPDQQQLRFNRRRSLSHGDADLFATVPSNPTFIRLQSSYSRSSTPPETGPPHPYPSHARSSSQGTFGNGRTMKASTPYVARGIPLGRSITPSPTHIPIGTQAHQFTTGGPGIITHRNNVTGRSNPGQSIPTPSNSTSPDLLTHHITDPVALAHSRRIIQIGAMVAHNPNNIDPSLGGHATMAHQQKIISQLDAVERHLKQDAGSYEAALQGCAAIRNALKQSFGAPQQASASPVIPQQGWNNDSSQSTVMSERQDGFGGYFDEDEFMSAVTTVDDLNDYKATG